MKNGRVGKEIKLVATLYTPASMITCLFHSERRHIYHQLAFSKSIRVPHFSNEHCNALCEKRGASLLLLLRKLANKEPYDTFSRFKMY